MPRLSLCLAVCLVLLAAVSSGSADTVVLKQGVSGYAGCTDTYMDVDFPTTNYGGLWYMHLYMQSDDPERSVLIRFDLDGVIPPGSAIQSATLSVWLYQLVDFTSSDWMSVGPYRLRDYRDWNETQATWNYIKGTTYWSTPGCEHTSFDRYAALDSRLYFYDTSAVSTYYHWDVTPSVLAWAGGAQNHGWLLRAEAHDGGGDGLSFNTKESSSTAYRPYLTITYDPPVAVEGSTWSRIKSMYR